jgi:hypothetical protein
VTVRAVLRRVVATCRGRSLDVALDEEVHQHLDMLAAEHRRRGLTPEDARLAARRDFGGIEQIKEMYRDARGVSALEHIRRDLAYAGRGLRKSPGFAIAVVVTLALGIGANTAVFTLIDAIRWRNFASEGSRVSVTGQPQSLGSRRDRFHVSAGARAARGGRRCQAGGVFVFSLSITADGFGRRRARASNVDPMMVLRAE